MSTKLLEEQDNLQANLMGAKDEFSVARKQMETLENDRANSKVYLINYSRNIELTVMRLHSSNSNVFKSR